MSSGETTHVCFFPDMNVCIDKHSKVGRGQAHLLAATAQVCTRFARGLMLAHIPLTQLFTVSHPHTSVHYCVVVLHFPTQLHFKTAFKIGANWTLGKKETQVAAAAALRARLHARHEELKTRKLLTALRVDYL